MALQFLCNLSTAPTIYAAIYGLEGLFDLKCLENHTIEAQWCVKNEEVLLISLMNVAVDTRLQEKVFFCADLN